MSSETRDDQHVGEGPGPELTSRLGYLLKHARLKLGELTAAALHADPQGRSRRTERYDRGLTDFLNVVDAERQFYGLQEQYAAAQVAQGEQFVQLYKSLGGGWQDYQAVPPIRLPQPAIIAAFRRVLTSSAP